MLQVYGFKRSRAFRVAWALEEVGAEYAFHALDPRAGEHRSPEYLALNPAGKVPTLVDGPLVLTESAAIVAWIGERFPEAGLAPPPGTLDRARYLEMMAFVNAELEQPIWSMGKHRFALPRAQRIPEMLETARWEYGRASTALEAMLQGRTWAIGERFSLADVMLGQTLSWAAGFGLPLGEAAADRLARSQARPGWARAAAKIREAVGGGA